MRSLLTMAVVLVMAADARSEDRAPGNRSKTELNSNRDKASYGIGLNIGRDLKRQGFDLSIAKLAVGIADAVAGREPQLSDEELQKVMEEFGKEHTAKRMAEFKVAAEKNKKDGEDFLAANKKKPKVVSTKSGLQYLVLNEGAGEKPKDGDVVTTQIVGKFLDGVEFENSQKRGEPATFQLGKGPRWTVALQLMSVGSKWRLFVPPDLAFGAEGYEPMIGPNMTLIYEIELLKTGKASKAEEVTPAVEEIPEQ